MAQGTGRGVQRFGTIVVDTVRFTGVGDGIDLPDGTVTLPNIPAGVEEYLLQLPGSGPNTHLEMDATGAIVWVANAV